MMNEIDSILELASIGCTTLEIIAELDLPQTEEEFNITYSSVMKKGKLKYQVALKRAQASQAKEDPSVLRWLAVQYLGQSVKATEAEKVVGKYDDYTRDQLIELLHGKKA